MSVCPRDKKQGVNQVKPATLIRTYRVRPTIMGGKG